MSQKEIKKNQTLSYKAFKNEVLADYKLACESRHTSLVGRKEVLNGKAKFGIFGDGKELPQIALSKVFQNGDYRSGYYRDQTMAMASGLNSIQQIFAQLYAHPNLEADPNTGGRMMNGHFATRMLDEKGHWKNQMEQKNFAADLSPTAAQMLKAVGLGLASKLYRQNKEMQDQTLFSNKGNEIVFATIGDASTSEGIFWESVNAACVMEIPVIFNVWDDGYGISVPKKYQTAKSSISESLKGMQNGPEGHGLDIYTVKGWDYAALCKTYIEAAAKCRKTHTPALIHVTEVTQPQGHSTSGSHERYKDDSRLQFEKEFDCIVKFKEWIILNKIATSEELQAIDEDAKNTVNEAKNIAYSAFQEEIIALRKEALQFINFVKNESSQKSEIDSICNALENLKPIIRKDIFRAVHHVLRLTKKEKLNSWGNLESWYRDIKRETSQNYSSNLYSESEWSALKVNHEAPNYEGSVDKAGFEIINAYFDAAFAKRKEMVAFGEDLGQIGDVNQGFAGLQQKYGIQRIFDTGIREATIIGQGQGLSMRGFRPIAEIQYLDYLLYGLQPLSDDVATLQYRTKGGQKSPMIVRTRGHRLEGIWHSGSPMGMILGALRGMYVCVPRNLSQAAGMYETILRSDEPALVIEPLNGYRLKEQMPINIGAYTIPLGKVEVLNEGTDITMVSYGSTLRICQDAIPALLEAGISVELIDVQTLIPFDISKDIRSSISKTSRLIIVDEDVPGGASAFIMQQLIEEQDVYKLLDSKPITLTAKANRPAYSTDGDYFSKPNAEDIYDAVISVMQEVKPSQY